MSHSEVEASISVAMCTYNGARYLQEQLETIAAQTRPPFELVISDDCSSDETLEILSEFAQTAAFPVHISQNTRQLGSTKNFDQTIRLCRGDYIALSDQDDRWRPEKLERLGKLLDLNLDIAMVFSDALLIDNNSKTSGATLWQSFRFTAQTRARFKENPGRVLLQRPVVTGATMLFRRSLLENVSEIPAAWMHDGWIAWMSVLWSRPLFTEDRLIEYRIHENQQLGIGRKDLKGRIAKIRSSHRAHYASVATEFEYLLQYIEQSDLSVEKRNDLAEQIKNITVFLRARAVAPNGFIRRLSFLVRHISSYRNFSSPIWRVLLRDFVMHDGESR